MIVARTVLELREALLAARTGNKRIGLVPTMGAFHAGHLHLMATAREECDITPPRVSFSCRGVRNASGRAQLVR